MIMCVVTLDAARIAFLQQHGFVVSSKGREFQSIALLVVHYLSAVVDFFCSDNLLALESKMSPPGQLSKRVVGFHDTGISAFADYALSFDSEIGLFDDLAAVIVMSLPYCVALLERNRLAVGPEPRRFQVPAMCIIDTGHARPSLVVKGRFTVRREPRLFDQGVVLVVTPRVPGPSFLIGH